MIPHVRFGNEGQAPGRGLPKARDMKIIMNMRDLELIIRSDPLISRVIATNNEAYLVGGYIRDLFRGIRSKDIDFAVRGDVKALISKVFPGERTTVIDFKKAGTIRVVDGDYTADFSVLKGDLDDDLYGRDFTMNAIAWSDREGFVDPLGGRNDIALHRIRGISEANFSSDPLRLLRAYRFAGEFGWKIEGNTRALIRKLASSIRLSALERITSEMIRSLDSPYCVRALKMAAADGLAGEIVSLEPEKLKTNIRALSLLDAFLGEVRERALLFLDAEFSQGLSYAGLIRAERLLHGSSPDKNLLRFSRASHKRLTVIGRLMETYGNKRMNRAQTYELFAEAGDAAVDFALLTRRPVFVREAERFLNMENLLSSERIMEITGLPPGTELGVLINEMRKMQFTGKLRNENDAARWLLKRRKQDT